jgi:hypothetical protein
VLVADVPIEHVELDPDYGGAAFRIGISMADYDCFKHRITAELQADLEAWYRLFNDDAIADAEAWKEDGRAIASRLQEQLGSRFHVTARMSR